MAHFRRFLSISRSQKTPFTGQTRTLSFSAAADEQNGGNHQRRMRYKRLFATGLFGSTLLVALAMKHKKQADWSRILSEASRISIPDGDGGGKFGDLDLYQFRGFVLTENILRDWHKLESFPFRRTDILLTSFPKTGTTWLQEIIYLLVSDGDYSRARSASMSDRFPYLEFPYPGLSAINKMSDPRLIKTHLAPSLLFGGDQTNDNDNNHHHDRNNKTKRELPKIIAIIRDPRDVLVSYYHFCRMNKMINYKGNFNAFFELFLDGKVPYGPVWRAYKDIRRFESSRLMMMRSANNEGNNIHIVSYEDLHRNFEAEVDRLTQFLGREKLNPTKMARLREHCSFREMEANPAVNYQHWDELGLRDRREAKFMRKGTVGDWRNHFTGEQVVRFARVMNERFKSEGGDEEEGSPAQRGAQL